MSRAARSIPAITISLTPLALAPGVLNTTIPFSAHLSSGILSVSYTHLIRRGEHVAVIGDNGTGKTTLLKIINQVVPPDTGSFTLGSKVRIGY